MKLKKRKKFTRFRGTHTHGRGGKKKARGKGHRGGVGQSGSGKRADQKKNLTIIRKKKGYFGKDKTRRGPAKKKVKAMTLKNINGNFLKLVKSGVAKKSGESYELDLKKYKIIGNDKVMKRIKIHALSASEEAINSVKDAGGEIILRKE